MTRTDIHRPSAPEFDPALYECVGVFDTCTDMFKGGHSQAERIALVRSLTDQGYRFGHGSSRQCGHCGAHIRYCALMVRADVKQMIYVGETCLDGRFEMTKAEFDRLRKSAQLDRERQRLLTAFTALCTTCPSLVYATYADNINIALENEARRVYGIDGHDAVMWAGLNWNLNVTAEIAAKARRYGSLSDKQANLINKLVGEQDVKWAAFTAKQNAKAAESAAAEPVVEGRQVVEGVIVGIKEVEDQFSYYGGTITKMTVKLSGGQRLYGTMPASINGFHGDLVRFTATVKVSDKDPSFGFFSRPTKGEIVSTEGRKVA